MVFFMNKKHTPFIQPTQLLQLIAAPSNDTLATPASMMCHHQIIGDELHITYDCRSLVPCFWQNLSKEHLLTDKLNDKLRKDYLWENTCLEVFLAILPNKTKNKTHTANDLAYVEYNMATNGDWNAYLFNQYRTPDNMPPVRLTNAEPPRVISNDDYVFSVCINLQNTWQTLKINKTDKTLSDCQTDVTWLCNITAVINKTLNPSHQPELLYFASKHATPADFHQKDCWFLL